MSCQRCRSDRIVNVSGKVNDCCHVTIGENDHDGYVPTDLEIGHGDYLEIEYCADCGQLQGDFPLMPSEMEDEYLLRR